MKKSISMYALEEAVDWIHDVCMFVEPEMGHDRKYAMPLVCVACPLDGSPKCVQIKSDPNKEFDIDLCAPAMVKHFMDCGKDVKKAKENKK